MLFETYFETLFLFSNRIVQDTEAAMDIVQECFVRFWQHKRILKVGDQLDKYLFQAVKFESFNHVRNTRRRSAIREKAAREISLVEEERFEKETDYFEQLYQAINRLPEERKKIFMMVCVDEMKYQEVADRLNISRNTVKTQLTRALSFLRKELIPEVFSTLLLFFEKK